MAEDGVVWHNGPWQELGASPAQALCIASSGWQVYNAPRPLPGQEMWQGPFRCGVFYAAGTAQDYATEWSDLRAVPVQSITNAEIQERIMAFCEREAVNLADALADNDGWAELAKACGYPWRHSDA